MDSIEGRNAVHLAVEQMHEGIQIIDRDWCYVYLNKAALIHGRSNLESLIGRTIWDCYPGIEKTSVFDLMKQVMADQKPRSMENQFEYPDGKKGWFDIFVEPHPMGILLRSMDITKRKKIEESFQHSQKIEAIGRLAGGIAHDFNNKLGVMLIFCELAMEELSPTDEKLRGYLKNILQSVEQATALTRQLLAFGRKQVLDLKVINLNDLIEQIKTSLGKLLGENISIKLHLDHNLQNVHIDPSQMDQILLNLAINSKNSMAEGGVLTIETGNVYLDESYCEVHDEVVPGQYVVLSVSDTGHGMSPEVMAHIFEPFFTTKKMGEGTGLGLSSVHGIVRQSRGHIYVYSELQRGTTFKIYFPAVNDQKTNLDNKEQMKTAPHGSEKILYVEDDPLLQDAFKKALLTAGYQVVAAGSGEEAIEIFEKNKGNFDLLLTDVILPKMNGSQISQELKKKGSDIKVIFVSGYTENAIVHHTILEADSILIQKPVSVSRLLMTLRQVLDGKMKKGIV